MFRKAYVRGVSKALMDTGAVKFASEELAAEVADAVGEQLPKQPVEEVAPEQTAEIASTLVDLSNQLSEASDSAADAAKQVAETGASAEAAKAASLRAKRAAAFLRHKLGQEGTGSTITGDKPHQMNTEPQAETAEAKMDLANRPENYANAGEVGVGDQEASGLGAVGEEHVVPGTGMGPVAEDGTNSATDAIKGASLRNLIRKIAQGSTITGNRPDQQNTLAQAAGITGEGALEAAARPQNYANAGVGNSSEAAKERASAVGTEMAHPKSMGQVGTPGTNSVIDQVAGKTAEDAEWLKRFKLTSAKYASVLPFWMNDGEKIAAIQYFMGLSPNQATSVATYIQKTAELPEGLKNYIEEKKKEEGTAKEEEGETKSEEEEEKKNKKEEEEAEKKASLKAGDIIQRLRRLNA